MKQFYLDIVAILEAVKDDTDLPLLKHFDLWNQNVSFMESDSPFEFPACFIEFPPITWSQLGNKVQNAEIEVIFHFVTKELKKTANNSPDRNDALNRLDFQQKTHKALHGAATSVSNGFQRTASITNHNHEHIVDTIEKYKTLITDCSAQPTQIAVNNIVPVINPETPS